jgi:hypothetical protein
VGGVIVLTALLLLWVELRVRKHGSARRKTSVVARTIVPTIIGLGGWFGAALVVLTFWTTLSLTSEVLEILAPSGVIALALTTRGPSAAVDPDNCDPLALAQRRRAHHGLLGGTPWP